MTEAARVTPDVRADAANMRECRYLRQCPLCQQRVERLLARLDTLERERDKYKRAHEVAAGFANNKLIPRAVAAEARLRAAEEARDELLDDALQLLDQHISDEVRKETQLRIIGHAQRWKSERAALAGVQAPATLAEPEAEAGNSARSMPSGSVSAGVQAPAGEDTP